MDSSSLASPVKINLQKIQPSKISPAQLSQDKLPLGAACLLLLSSGIPNRSISLTPPPPDETDSRNARSRTVSLDLASLPRKQAQEGIQDASSK
jgi:hypothetical protein